MLVKHCDIWYHVQVQNIAQTRAQNISCCRCQKLSKQIKIEINRAFMELIHVILVPTAPIRK